VWAAKGLVGEPLHKALDRLESDLRRFR